MRCRREALRRDQRVEFYTDVHETLPDPVLLAPMLDTGSRLRASACWSSTTSQTPYTLALVLDLMREMGADARNAVIYGKPRSVVDPDFVWRRTDEWIVFPWSAEPARHPVGGLSAATCTLRGRA